jgi:thymidylate synthase (FAD)
MVTLRSDADVRLIRHSGDDGMVVAAAKVSVDPDEALQQAIEDNASNPSGIIRYLMRHRHGSPFEHGSMTFYVETPIFSAREHMRHRAGWSYNETSGRYRKLEPVFWVPGRDRNIIPKEPFKPARPEFLPISDEILYETSQYHYRMVYKEAWERYEKLMDEGISKEAARAVLPLGIYTSYWATCNPRSLMHFLGLRTHEKDATFTSYPQAEIEDVARKMEDIFAKMWPITYEMFNQNGRVSP